MAPHRLAPAWRRLATAVTVGFLAAPAGAAEPLPVPVPLLPTVPAAPEPPASTAPEPTAPAAPAAAARPPSKFATYGDEQPPRKTSDSPLDMPRPMVPPMQPGPRAFAPPPGVPARGIPGPYAGPVYADPMYASAPAAGGAPCPPGTGRGTHACCAPATVVPPVGSSVRAAQDLQRLNALAEYFVLFREDWLAGTADLNPSGVRHFEGIARRLGATGAPVRVEPSGSPELDEMRRATVVSLLVQGGLPPQAASGRVVIGGTRAEGLQPTDIENVYRGFVGQRGGLGGAGGFGGGFGGGSGGGFGR